MALLPVKDSIPQGAIKLDRNEAFRYQYQQIKNWPHFSDIWPFKVGVPMLAGLAGISALMINRHFRIRLKLRRDGLVVSQIATAISSIVFATTPHLAYISEDILLRITPCPLCIETRAGFIQVAGAVLYPCISAPLANFFIAARVGSYRLPHFANGQEIFKLWLKFIKPMREKFLILTVVNFMFAGCITYAEAKSVVTIRMKMMELAKQAREENEKK
ncbi:uncharacterized protein LOC130675710 [Microplitis mediator]|uniref:uncharacterized protein LOC130675710 n=1 Tax=Microplitis mediator TaxID=375433 RepID=UPI0025545B59|nr:uncharacterized protein LOC130675710 [Microplitis mediator]